MQFRVESSLHAWVTNNGLGSFGSQEKAGVCSVRKCIELGSFHLEKVKERESCCSEHHPEQGCEDGRDSLKGCLVRAAGILKRGKWQ